MFVAFILSNIRKYFRYRETVRILSGLSDRELGDIGVPRCNIDRIARETVAN